MICMKSSNCTLKQSKTNSPLGNHPDNLMPYGILPTYGIGAYSSYICRSNIHNPARAFISRFIPRQQPVTIKSVINPVSNRRADAPVFWPSPTTSCLIRSYNREGVTPDQTRSVFEDLFRRLGLDENVLEVDMLFCGPNIEAGLHDARHSFKHNPLPAETERTNETDRDGGVAVSVPQRQHYPSGTTSCPSPSGVSVRFRFNTGLYHDVSGLFSAPDALFLFNAGLWGYDDWVPTLEHILGCGASSIGIETVRAGSGGASPQSSQVASPTVDTSIPPPIGVVVVTSYCAEEAEDDMETVERVLLQNARRSECSDPSATSRPGDETQVEWLWKPEVNPHRSLVPRHAACAVEGRVLFENQMWQAIRPSRSSH